jgi:glutamate/tyrosine decarboxylase-like PLP-dependent enzyme
VGDAIVYLSDQTHASIDRGLRLLGIHPRHLRRIPTDAGLRLDTRKLAEGIRLDRAAGR